MVERFLLLAHLYDLLFDGVARHYMGHRNLVLLSDPMCARESLHVRVRVVIGINGDNYISTYVHSSQVNIGRRLTNALAYAGRVESTVLREEPETLDAELLQEEEAEAKVAAEKERPGLTMFTDGSRLDDGAAGYAVAWKNGQSWKGIKTHMGFNQEAYDAECAALARALEAAQRRPTTPPPPRRGGCRSGSRSSRTRKQPSDGWPRTNPAPASSTHCRPGSTSLRCGERSQASSSRSDGARHTGALPAMRRPMSGQRSRRRSQTPAG